MGLMELAISKTPLFQAPLSSERFKANVVSAMQKKKIIGVTSRYVIISKKKTKSRLKAAIQPQIYADHH